jgi:hypothetical protein
MHNAHLSFIIWHFTETFQLVLSVSIQCEMRNVKCASVLVSNG